PRASHSPGRRAFRFAGYALGSSGRGAAGGPRRAPLPGGRCHSGRPFYLVPRPLACRPRSLFFVGCMKRQSAGRGRAAACSGRRRGARQRLAAHPLGRPPSCVPAPLRAAGPGGAPCPGKVCTLRPARGAAFGRRGRRAACTFSEQTNHRIIERPVTRLRLKCSLYHFEELTHMPTIITVLVVVIVAAAVGALCFYLGITYRKRMAEAKLGSAEEEAKRIVNDAIKAAEQKRKETIVEAKDEAFKLKSEADKEIKEIKDRRAEISRQERRMDQKEEALDKRTAT